MAKNIANVVVASDTFASWISRTNQLADAMTNYAVTVESNTTGATVTGNGSITGIFAANTIAISTALRGGTVAASANLIVSSNVSFQGAVLYSSSNLDIQVANASINASALYIRGGLANVTSNVSVSTTNVSIIAANSALSGGNVHVTSNTQVNAANIALNATNTTISGTTLNITSNVDIVTASLNANAVTTINGNTTVTGNNLILRANTTNVYLQLQSNGTTTNSTLTSDLLTVTANVQFSNTINVVGNATVNGALTVNNTSAIGNSTVTGFVNVSSYGTFGGVVNSTGFNVGANVSVSNTQYHIGNATVNTVISSTFIDTDGYLRVLGNAAITDVFSAGNTTVNGSLTTSGFVTVGNSSVGTINSVALNIGSNVNLSTTQINVGNATVNTVITSTSIDTDGTLSVLGTTTLSNSISVSGNAVFSTTANVAGAVRAGNTTVNGNLTVNTFLVVGTVTNTANLNVTTSANVTNLTISGFANVQSNLSITDDYVIVVTSNTNVGANTTGAQTIFSFPKTTYSSAKLTAQVKTADNSNTQIQEIILAHDNSGNAFLTVYGTISAPISANLGVFTTSINNANVELYFQQNTANSKIKVIAHLIV